MENQETRKEEGLSLPKDTQINLVVNNSDYEEDSIDLGRVFRTFKEKRRVFAWLLLFCLVAGISAGLLMYQINQKPLTVASVVTLRYQIDMLDPNVQLQEGEEPSEDDYIHAQVTDLTSPDGKTELDLSRIRSSYVLRTALQNIELTKDISLSALQSNIAIQRIPTEKSRSQQEMINSMRENTSTIGEAYRLAQELEIKYSNQFIVSLTNGFGDEDSGKIYLEDAELQALLDKILVSYNDYLVRTYGQLRVPSDEISIIDTAALDTIESLDQLRAAMNNLVTFCESQEDGIRNYHSWKTGLTLEELKGKAKMAQDVNLDYLYSYVYANSIVKDPDSMLTRYQYELRTAQAALDEINDSITANQQILDTYKNDEIYVSTQESDTTKSTSFTTEYYNELVIMQTENYKKASELQMTVRNLQGKIANLMKASGTVKTEEIAEELEKAVAVSGKVYKEISDHVSEILESATYRTYAEASVAQGKTENFITGSMKNMLMFGAVGAVLAIMLWFFSALAPEFRHRDEDKEKQKKQNENDNGKEAAEA